MRYVVILAGGAGTRLWPLSRKGMPKQLLPLVDGNSLLRVAYERVQGALPDANVLVCASRAYVDVVAEILPELPAENLLGEPEGRDSLNAVAWCSAVLRERDPGAVVAFLTADHIIRPVDAFQAALDEAFRVAEQRPDTLVTFGVVPTAPHTGFGYLRLGEPVVGFESTVAVEEFKEKPDAETAQRYVDGGGYWWNAGLFVWRAETFLRQMRELGSAAYEPIVALAADPSRLDEIYPTLPKDSVDFGVMEPVSAGKASATIAAVRLPIEWYDVGGFPALAPHLPQQDGNAVDGQAVALDSTGNLIVNRGADGSIVAVVGLTDTVVVTAGDVTLVCPMDRAEDIKKLVAQVREVAGDRYA